MGRVPRAGLPRRRRACSSRAATSSRSTATSPSWSPAPAAAPERCVLDGEIVIAGAGGLDFDALLLRIHPAASRVTCSPRRRPPRRGLRPARARRGGSARSAAGRAARAAGGARSADAAPPRLSDAGHRDRAVAQDWFSRFEGAGLDGVVAKRAERTYQPDKRVMLKVKHQRTADCVVAGFRWHKNGPGTMVGSLLLGLYDEEGTLHHVGVTSSLHRRRGGRSWWRSSRRCARARSRVIPWRGVGRAARPATQRMPGRREPLERGRTCRGSRCGSSGCARWRTTICRGTASATRRLLALAAGPTPADALRPAGSDGARRAGQASSGSGNG